MRPTFWLLAAVILFAVSTGSQGRNSNAVSKGEPATIALKDVLNANGEYEVWVEDATSCRPLGKINPADVKMIFVRVKEEAEYQPFCNNCRSADDSVKLEPIPDRDLEEETSMEKEKKPPVFYATAPYYKEELPDGRLKLTYLTHGGAIITDVIPSQSPGTKFIGEIKEKK